MALIDTVLARLGQLQDSSFTIRCWDVANALLGDIAADQPSLLDSYDSGDGAALALSPTDDRLYATGAHYQDASTPRWLQVFKLSDGSLVTRTNLTAIDATILNSYCAVVPSSGFVWVSVERVEDGQIWEFDTAGVFQRIVDTIPITDVNPIDLHAFDVINDILYYAIAQTVVGYGIARWNIATHTALTPLVPSSSHFQVIALARITLGRIAAMGVNKDTAAYGVRVYQTDGTLVSDGGPSDHTNQLTGCAAAPDENTWTDEQSSFPNVVSKVDADTGTVTATILDDVNLSAANIMGLAGVLGTPDPVTYEICRLRRAPHINVERKRNYHQRFELDMEVGLGTIPDPDVAPNMRLRWSDDGGHTWSSYYALSAGVAGAFGQRMIKNQLGSARDRVYEVSTCDDAAWRLLAAYLDIVPGTR